MAQHGIKVFDQTLQETNLLLSEIEDEMGDPRRKIAYHALRGVLFSLRDRLPADEAAQLAAQLPMLVRGLFYEGYRPTGKPEKYGESEFVARVSDELQKAGGANALNATKAVLAVLQRRVEQGEIQDVKQALPHDLRRLWPDRIPV